MTDTTARTTWVYDDGGRTAAGFRGEAGDCVTRAITIAISRPYREVYDALSSNIRGTRTSRGRVRVSARSGLPRFAYDRYLTAAGWTWTPTMTIGGGCRVHLRADQLPSGRIIARLSHHLVAVIDGVIHDTDDPSRGGTRCVYGYFSMKVP